MTTTNQEIKARIKNVMAGVFGVPVEQISEDSSPDTIEKWDSLHHMNLIIALEEDFTLQFSDDEIAELLNFAMIQILIQEKVQL